MHINKLILGGGISGIAFAHFYSKDDYLIIDENDTLGGLCRTFKIGDSIFDFSGHFLHFNKREIENYVLSLVNKHNTGEFLVFDRKASICMFNKDDSFFEVDYPFQANIDQLPKQEFVECLLDLYYSCAFKDEVQYNTFEDAMISIFGKAIADKFFRPYNEKLYRTKLSELDANAMKRFIPMVHFDEVMKNIKEKQSFGYNSKIVYSPSSGIQGLVDAFLKEKSVNHLLNERVERIDLEKKIVYTNNREISYDTLINTFPLNVFEKLTTRNKLNLKSVKVDVYNITFNKKCSNIIDKSWTYFPSRTSFYRIGFYDYFSKKDKTSIYVEVSRKEGDSLLSSDIVKELKELKLIDDDAIVDDLNILTIDPGYVILEPTTEKDVTDFISATPDTHFLGRYGRWTYDSIGDNIFNSKQLAEKLSL